MANRAPRVAPQVAECAGEQGRFEAMYNLLVERQDRLGLKPGVSLRRSHVCAIAQRSKSALSRYRASPKEKRWVTNVTFMAPRQSWSVPGSWGDCRRSMSWTAWSKRFSLPKARSVQREHHIE
jgi:hypothetical protein